MKTKILKIEKVKVDENLYPRIKWDFVTRARYYNALKSGAVFPPITVAVNSEGKNILVDGQHRLLANKDNKETHIECEILEGLTDEQIYEEAVKRNVAHGRQFSTQEIVKIAVRLKDLGYDDIKVSELTLIPLDKLTEFVAKRTTLITNTNSKTSLKSPLQHLAGVDLATEPNQSVFNSKSQIQLLDSVICLLKNNWLDTKSEVVLEKAVKIYELLVPYIPEEEIAVK